MSSDDITRIYAGYFNRAPDPAGLNYWIGRQNAGMSLLEIAQSFSVQTEATSLYSFLNSSGSGSPSSFLESIYRNLFDRSIDSEGSSYWTGQLNSGKPVGRMIVDIISGARGDDLRIINNKAAIGQYYCDELERSGRSFDPDSARKAYGGVTKDAATVVASLVALNNLITGGTGPAIAVGSTFTLTAGTDALNSGGGNDTFNAMVDSDTGSNQTLTSADTVNGGGGPGDTFNITFDVASAVSFPAANISNVEVFNLRNISGKALTFDSALITGDNVVNSDRSTSAVSITNLSAGAVAGLIGDATTPNGSLNIGYAASGGAATVYLAGAAGEANVTFTSAPSTVTLNAVFTANTIGKLDVGSAAQTLAINASASLKILSGITGNALKTITVTGSATNPTSDNPAVKLGDVGASTIDASAMSVGGIEVDLGDFDPATSSIKGGQGRDIIKGGDGIDTINGNAGNDKIEGDEGADILTGGAGADRFEFDTGQGERESGLTIGDVITDFTIGQDKIEFEDAPVIASAQQAAVQAAVSALAAGATAAQIATAMATANTTNVAAAFAAFGGSTYVYFERTGAAAGVAADDIFIKLTGVASGFTFAGGIEISS